MLLERFKYSVEKVRNIIEAFKDLFIEFDRDFIENSCIMWYIDTIFYFKSIRELKEFLEQIILDERIGWYLLGISNNSKEKILMFSLEDDVAYVGDDLHIMYSSPIFWYGKSHNYSYYYYISKGLETRAKTKHSDICLLLKHSKNKNKNTLSVEFMAWGKNRAKYYRMARKIMRAVI